MHELVGARSFGAGPLMLLGEAYRFRDMLSAESLAGGHKLTEIRYGVRMAVVEKIAASKP